MATLWHGVSRIALAVLTTLPGALALAANVNDVDDGFAGFRLVDGDALERMRGGFIGSVGGQPLQLSFGIEQALFVNDALLVTTRLTVPNVNQPTSAQLQQTVAAVASTNTPAVAPAPPVIGPVVAPTPPTVAPVLAPAPPSITPITAPTLVAPSFPIITPVGAVTSPALTTAAIPTTLATAPVTASTLSPPTAPLLTPIVSTPASPGGSSPTTASPAAPSPAASPVSAASVNTAPPHVAAPTQLVTNMPAAQVAIARLEQVTITTMQTQAGLVNVLQIGPANTFSLDMAQLPAGVANFVQNTLDNQTIRQVTSIQVSANSLSLLRASTFNAALQRQLLSVIR
jgi:hypothetical protein